MDLRLYCIYMVLILLIYKFNAFILLKYIVFFLCSLFIIYLGVLFFIKKKNISDIFVLIKRLLRIAGTVSLLINSNIDMTALYSYMMVQELPGLPDLTDNDNNNNDKDKEGDGKDKSVKKVDPVDKLETTSNQLYYLKMATVIAGIILGVLFMYWLNITYGGGGGGRNNDDANWISRSHGRPLSGGDHGPSGPGPGPGPGPGGSSHGSDFDSSTGPSSIKGSWFSFGSNIFSNISYFFNNFFSSGVNQNHGNFTGDKLMCLKAIYSDFAKNPNDAYLKIIGVVKHLISEGKMSESTLAVLTSRNTPNMTVLAQAILTTEFIREYMTPSQNPVISINPAISITIPAAVQSEVEIKEIKEDTQVSITIPAAVQSEVEIKEIKEDTQVSITIPATVQSDPSDDPDNRRAIAIFINIINDVYNSEPPVISETNFAQFDELMSNNTIFDLIGQLYEKKITPEILYLTKNFNFDLNNPDNVNRLHNILHNILNYGESYNAAADIHTLEDIHELEGIIINQGNQIEALKALEEQLKIEAEIEKDLKRKELEELKAQEKQLRAEIEIKKAQKVQQEKVQAQKVKQAHAKAKASLIEQFTVKDSEVIKIQQELHLIQFFISHVNGVELSNHEIRSVEKLESSLHDLQQAVSKGSQAKIDACINKIFKIWNDEISNSLVKRVTAKYNYRSI